MAGDPARGADLAGRAASGGGRLDIRPDRAAAGWRCAPARRPAPLGGPDGLAYAALEERFRRIADVEGALAMLHWDTAVMMPPRRHAARGEQLATLKRLAHELADPRRDRRALAGADGGGRPRPLAAGQPARDAPQVPPRPRARAGPGRAMVRATAACEMRWREARPRPTSPCCAPRSRRSCA